MTYYVDSAALPGGDGSRERPFFTISSAAAIAQPGSLILVSPGVYREHVNPAFGGTADAPIIYRSEQPGQAVITGAERADNWEHYQGNTWKAVFPNRLFGNFNPYQEQVTGDWYYGSRVVHTGEVYLDEGSLYEAETLEEVLLGDRWAGAWPLNRGEDLTACRWYAQVGEEATVIFANFGGRNPKEHCIEINVRRNCFFPSQTGRNYITLDGFTVCRSACTWAPPTAFQDGMIGAHWSKGWVIENCEIFQARCSGISIGKYLQPGNENKWSNHAKKSGTQNERDVICRAVNEGWDKETVGSHIIRNCHIHDCGQTGIVGHLGCAFSLIENNHIHHINNKQELDGAEIGGIKLHAAIDTVIRRNHIHHCTHGLWLDWQAQGTRVTQNLFHHNTPPDSAKIIYHLEMGEDIFVEVSHGPTLIDNNLLLSDHAARLSTQGVAMVHNLICGSFTKVGTGTDNGGLPRYTPYHVPHGTKINGFMTFLHGDMRFYNNIFLQQGVRFCFDEDMKSLNIDLNKYTGTFVYDEYPDPEEYEALFADGNVFNYNRYYTHLPVSSEGNVFANSARPCRTEKSSTILEEPMSFQLEERADGWYFTLHTTMKPEGYDTTIVDTARMGEAFEPEQLFEAPDGSPITINTDYFGIPVDSHPIPGPFAAIPGEAVRVW